MISIDGATCQILHEGKWIRDSFDRNIRIDQPTHGRGQTHAHILGRKGSEIGVVNIDGSGSHGSKFQLKDGDADALRASGFVIRDDNVVEWFTSTYFPRLSAQDTEAQLTLTRKQLEFAERQSRMLVTLLTVAEAGGR